MKLLKSIVLAASAGLLVGCHESMNQLGGQNSTNLSDQDNAFFKNVTISNETEIKCSEMAMTMAQSQAVKDFAQHMINDHREAEQKVAAVASEKGVTLPTTVDTAHQDKLDDLKGKTGNDFDKAYVDLQVNAHRDTIEMDQDEINQGNDPEVKSLASQLLPTLQMHQKMADQLKAGM